MPGGRIYFWRSFRAMQPDSDDLLRLFFCREVPQPAQGGPDFVLGVLAGTASLEEDNMGLPRATQPLIAGPRSTQQRSTRCQGRFIWPPTGVDEEAAGHSAAVIANSPRKRGRPVEIVPQTHADLFLEGVVELALLAHAVEVPACRCGRGGRSRRATASRSRRSCCRRSRSPGGGGR